MIKNHNNTTLINAFTSRFTQVLKDLVDVIPDAARSQLHPLLKEPGLAIGYSDPSGKCVLELRSKSLAEKKPISINGKLIPFQLADPTRYAEITFTSKIPIERQLFPYIPDEPLKPTIKISAPNIAFHNFCFCTTEYKKKYWSKINLVSYCSNFNIPFIVTENGLFIGRNLLHGLEVDGKRHEKYIEFVLIFGNSNLIPRDNAGVRDIAFAAFFSLVTGKQGDQWSFSEFLKNLKAPVEQNVLLLGSYTSEQDEKDFAQLKSCLASLGYNGFMLKDSPDLAIQTSIEKSLAASICSCFIIALDSEASGHLAEFKDLLFHRFRPVIIIRYKGAKPSTTFLEDTIALDDNFRIAEVAEISNAELLPHIKWAKERVTTRIQCLNNVNSWRSENKSVTKPTLPIKDIPINKKRVGRNEPCPCGSNKKYKKCCGR